MKIRHVKLVFGALSLFLVFQLDAQLPADSAEIQYRSPVDIPMNLSGNFGEFRTNHFHTGIDIKTNGRVGVPVYAIEDGWVRRVKVSPFGYGKALYIDHETGHTSVYAHLSSYNDTISSFLSLAQEKLKRNAVDIFPSKNRIPVKKGELLGYTGNSGRSGGPHLHFEIRTSDTEKPLNPLIYFYNVNDRTAPVLAGLVVESISDELRGKVTSTKKYYPKAKSGYYEISELIKVPDLFGLSIHSLDRITGSSNSFGIYSVRMEVDDEPVYSFKFDSLDFSTNRYINAHNNYSIFKKEKSSIHRCFKVPNNQLDIYGDSGDGIFRLSSEEVHNGVIIVSDANGNESKLKFRFKLGENTSKEEQENLQFLAFDEPNKLEIDGFSAIIPAYRLINDEIIGLNTVNSINKYSASYKLGEENIPIQNLFLVSLRLSEENLKDSTKYFVSRLSSSNGKSYNEGGEFKDGWIRTRLKQFGTYYINYDDTPPRVSVSTNLFELNKSNKFYITVSDDNSGVSDYYLWIGEDWIPLYYNYKRGRLEAEINSDGIVKKGTSYLISVKDERGNETLLKGVF